MFRKGVTKALSGPLARTRTGVRSAVWCDAGPPHRYLRTETAAQKQAATVPHIRGASAGRPSARPENTNREAESPPAGAAMHRVENGRCMERPRMAWWWRSPGTPSGSSPAHRCIKRDNLRLLKKYRNGNFHDMWRSNLANEHDISLLACLLQLKELFGQHRGKRARCG